MTIVDRWEPCCELLDELYFILHSFRATLCTTRQAESIHYKLKVQNIEVLRCTVKAFCQTAVIYSADVLGLSESPERRRVVMFSLAAFSDSS